jgi:hypothetical protein
MAIELSSARHNGQPDRQTDRQTDRHAGRGRALGGAYLGAGKKYAKDPACLIGHRQGQTCGQAWRRVCSSVQGRGAGACQAGCAGHARATCMGHVPPSARQQTQWEKAIIASRIETRKVNAGSKWVLFESCIEAARRLGVSQGNIWSCLHGKRKTAAGHEFRAVDIPKDENETWVGVNGIDVSDSGRVSFT